MNEFDVVLGTEDLLVLGPVDNVEVQVDIGPTGRRGSKYYVGSGDPNTPGVIPITDVPQIGDFFINSSTAGDFGWLYVYQAGQNNIVSWQKAVKLQPSLYSNNLTVNFVNGLATGSDAPSILISEMTSDTSIINSNRYVVQLTALYADPIIVTIQQKRIPAPNYERLFLDLRALRFASGTWLPVTGQVVIGATVSVV
jgi:hypothetical protein